MKTVFFDLDDTLYSRGQPFVEAAGICFGEQGLDYYAVYLACVSGETRSSRRPRPAK